jgi:hypothetical protein
MQSSSKNHEDVIYRLVSIYKNVEFPEVFISLVIDLVKILSGKGTQINITSKIKD